MEEFIYVMINLRVSFSRVITGRSFSFTPSYSKQQISAHQISYSITVRILKIDSLRKAHTRLERQLTRKRKVIADKTDDLGSNPASPYMVGENGS